MFGKKEKEYLIYQIKQNFDFDKKTALITEQGKPYCQLIAYGKSSKKISDFAEIAWDLCNIFCWDTNNEKLIYDEPISKNGKDYIYPISRNFEGIVNSDVIICEKENPKIFMAAGICGWEQCKTKEEAEQYILKNNPILRKYRI